jgi:GNAT superfamily N-acetyltransferase
MGLGDADFGLLQRNIEAITEQIAALEYSLVVETDFRGLGEFLRGAGYPVFNQSFDPDRSDLGPEAFWLRVIDSYGRTVAGHGERIIHTDDLVGMFRDGTIWLREGVAFGRGVPPPEVRDMPVRVAGRVAHAGALWVEPAHRKKGLSLYLPYLSRALCLRNYETDFHTGIVLPGLAGSIVPRLAYGYPHVDLCYRGFCPPTGREETIYLCWMTQAECMAGFRQLPDHPLYPLAPDAAREARRLKA